MDIILNIDEEVAKYSAEFKKYSDFTDILRSTFEKILEAEDLSYDHIEARTKTIESYKEKITRDGKDYKDPLNEITDLSGIRIVVYSIKDVEPIVNMLKKQFVIDEKNSEDKIKKLKLNEFGYLSQHFIVSFNSERANLVENEKFKLLKAEIQVRTVLQHAWATIDHKINYKSKVTLPEEQQRDFYSISAILEMVDKHFQSAIDAQNKQIEEYKSKIKDESTTNIETNSETVYYCLASEKIEKILIKNCQDIDRLTINTKNMYPSQQFIKIINDLEISTIGEIEKIIQNDEYYNKVRDVVNVWAEKVADKHLKLVLTKLVLVRLLIYFSVSDDTKKQLAQGLLSTGIADIIKDN